MTSDQRRPVFGCGKFVIVHVRSTGTYAEHSNPRHRRRLIELIHVGPSGPSLAATRVLQPQEGMCRISNILISAAVALVVALGTEWFAKPWLEARKERILEQHKSIRRAATIAIDEFHRLGEYIDTGRDTSKPEQIDEFRSLRQYVDSMWGQRDREAMQAMINAVLYPGLDPIYPTLPGHPRTVEEDAHLAYWAALFILAPRHRIRHRNTLFLELKRLLDREAIPDSRRPRRRGEPSQDAP